MSSLSTGYQSPHHFLSFYNYWHFSSKHTSTFFGSLNFPCFNLWPVESSIFQISEATNDECSTQNRLPLLSVCARKSQKIHQSNKISSQTLISVVKINLPPCLKAISFLCWLSVDTEPWQLPYSLNCCPRLEDYNEVVRLKNPPLMCMGGCLMPVLANPTKLKLPKTQNTQIWQGFLAQLIQTKTDLSTVRWSNPGSFSWICQQSYMHSHRYSSEGAWLTQTLHVRLTSLLFMLSITRQLCSAVCSPFIILVVLLLATAAGNDAVILYIVSYVFSVCHSRPSPYFQERERATGRDKQRCSEWSKKNYSK